MKRRWLSLGLSFLLMVACTGCGGGYGSSDSFVSNSSGGANYGSSAFESGSGQEYASDASLDDSGSLMTENRQNQDISKEMLVYTCNMTIDVLEFDEAVSSFRTRLNEFGGFVESEEYNDSGSYSRYYDRRAEVWHTYTARVRIPSSKYENFCSGVSSIGDLRSKTANVENVSQEYTDAKTAMEIYEAKQERYIALLATVESESYALEIERELTELQITIARLRTRMNQIETDVAYSYVNVVINEVKEYRDEPLKTDTFFQRLGNVITDTWEHFLNFLEGLLFFVIRVFPYLLIILVIVVIFKLFKLTDKIRDRRLARRQKKLEREARYAQQMQMCYQQNQQIQQNQQNQQNQP